MVAPGFSQPICFNPAIVYFIAGLLAGVSYMYYISRHKHNSSSAPRRGRR